MRLYYLLPLLTIVTLSCGFNSNKESKRFKRDVLVMGTLPDNTESFENFNVQFHSDSIFQLSRIAFPIGGQFVDGFENQEWTPQNWNTLKTPVNENADTTQFKHSITKTDTLVIEKFWIEESGFKVERHFKRIGRKWYLTYYDNINL